MQLHASKATWCMHIIPACWICASFMQRLARTCRIFSLFAKWVQQSKCFNIIRTSMKSAHMHYNGSCFTVLGLSCILWTNDQDRMFSSIFKKKKLSALRFCKKSFYKKNKKKTNYFIPFSFFFFLILWFKKLNKPTSDFWTKLAKWVLGCYILACTLQDHARYRNMLNY